MLLQWTHSKLWNPILRNNQFYKYDSKCYKILWNFTSIQNIRYKLIDRDDMIRFSKFWTTLWSWRKRWYDPILKKEINTILRENERPPKTMTPCQYSIESNWSIDDLQKRYQFSVDIRSMMMKLYHSSSVKMGFVSSGVRVGVRNIRFRFRL